MNNVILIGRLTRNPELIIGKNNVKICRFTLAVTRNFKNKFGEYETDFISCVAMNKVADLLVEYTKKGDLISVKGSLRTGNYVNKNNEKIYTTDVLVDKITFLQPTAKKEEPKVETQSDLYSDFAEEITENFLD